MRIRTCTRQSEAIVYKKCSAAGKSCGTPVDMLAYLLLLAAASFGEDLEERCQIT